MPTPPNASRTDIIAMLRDGYSNSRISRELRCDKTRVARLRQELGLPAVVMQPLTLEQKWATRTRPVDGGHLEWTGEHAKSAGTPVMRYKEASYSPAAVAFELRHGRPPQGYAKADCGFPRCVAPDHVNDEPGRQQARQAVRAQRGLGDLPDTCVSGHPQAEHGLLEPDGTSYCGLCKLLDKRARRGAAPQRLKRRPASLREAYERHAEPGEDGHVRWAGSMSHGAPAVWFEGGAYSAYRAAFRLHHGREPVGVVTSACDVPACVAGAHVEDQPMRQKSRALYAAIFGAAS